MIALSGLCLTWSDTSRSLGSFEPRHVHFSLSENRGADQLRSNCAPRTWSVPLFSLNFQNSKFQSSSHILWPCSPAFVGPGRKSRVLVFSRCGSIDFLFCWSKYEVLRVTLVIPVFTVVADVFVVDSCWQMSLFTSIITKSFVIRWVSCTCCTHKG